MSIARAPDLSASVTVELHAHHDDVLTRLAVIGDQLRCLKHVTYTCDVSFQESEFLYLFDAKPGQLISAHGLARAVSYFFKKNIFETITITTTAEDDGGLSLHINFVGLWTFSKLVLHGFMLGKDMYRQYYLIEPGEQFDEEKHILSLEKIKEAFAQHGYLHGAVDAVIERNHALKSIDVHLSLRKGDRFLIGAVTYDIECDDSVGSIDQEHLKEQVHKRFFNTMSRGGYDKQRILEHTTALKQFLFHKGFVHVSIELTEELHDHEKKVDLAFTIQMHRKREFVFLGNHYFSVQDLCDHVALFGRSAWLLPVSLLEHDIKDLYHKKGFWGVQVTSKEESDRSFFMINEGPQALVAQVSLAGVKHFDPHDLVQQFFVRVGNKKVYDSDIFDAAVESIIALYVSQGFLHAQSVGRSYGQIDNYDQYSVIVSIYEGDRSYFGSVRIEGFEDLECEWPFARMLQEGEAEPFSDTLLIEQRQWLLDYFRAQGYAQVAVTPEVQYKGELVLVTWKVQRGTHKLCFGKTVIAGNISFPFEYITRELCYTQGQSWDKECLKQTLIRLKGLEVFDAIHLYPYKSALHEGENPIVLKMHKDDPFELRLRLGFAAQQVSKSLHTAGLTYRAGGAFVVKNPFNCGDRLLFEADVTRSSRTTLMQYRRPWFFNIPIATIFQAYSNRYEQPGLIGTVKNLYDVRQQGFLFGFSDHGNHREASINVGIEWMKTTVCDHLSRAVCSVDALARAINFTPQLLDRDIPYFLFEPTLLLHYVDHRLDPTQGFFTLFSCKGMIPVSPNYTQAYLIRVSVEQSFFLSWRSAVWALRARCGHIFNHELKNIVPIERFYLGGANSVRAYETDRCPPLGVFVEDDGSVQHVPRGGKSLVNVNLELRFPVYKSVRGVIFQDCGYLSGNFLRPDEHGSMVAGTGFGLRYTTPFGPVRFDIAWKWRRSYPGESPYAWFVSLGQAF